jgi:hypothetical protein
MLISNDEPFVKLEVAAKAFFSYDIFCAEPSTRHFEQLEIWLDLYAFIYGVCNISTPANPTLQVKSGISPKKISGMCKTKLCYNISDPYHPTPPSVSLVISPFSGVNLNLNNCDVYPIEEDLNHKNYYARSYVRLTKLIEHAKEVGVDLDAIFLEEIISEDSQFRELKRLSKIAPDGAFNLKQATNMYLKYFDGILEETIIAACELASARYDRINQQTKTPQEIAKENLDDISELFSNTTATTENIEQFKSALPDVWQKALFEHSTIETIETIDKKSSLDGLEHTSENLEVLRSIVIEFWENKDPEIAAKEATNDVIKAYIKDKHPDLSPTLAKNIAMIVRPNKYK